MRIVQEISIKEQQLILPAPAGPGQEKTVVVMVSDSKLGDFAKHVDDMNVDFKENIMKKVEMIKLKDTADLQKRVDEVKKDEQAQCEKLNKEYQKREDREHHILEKTK
jgi:hypothetical protein